jgi:hypothetical protein
MKLTYREATTTVALTIGARNMPTTIPAGTSVKYVVPRDPESDVVYVTDGARGGAVYRRYLQDVDAS